MFSIILPARNNAALTRACLSTVIQSVHLLNLDVEFILINDCFTQRCAYSLRIKNAKVLQLFSHNRKPICRQSHHPVIGSQLVPMSAAEPEASRRDYAVHLGIRLYHRDHSSTVLSSGY
jgi:hypothetical protein